jgi:CBS domain-containing protein
MKNLPLADFMSETLLTAAPDESLVDAMARMEQHEVHHLLVMDQGRLAGILSSADQLKLALLRRPGPQATDQPADEALRITVRDVMQTHVAVLRSNASLRDAARALSLGGFHALPVLAIDGSPVGIVTSSDLLSLLSQEIDDDVRETAERDETPSQPGSAAMPLLLEVLRAAEVYLRSGESGHQHARLSRAVQRARERVGSSDRPDP